MGFFLARSKNFCLHAILHTLVVFDIECLEGTIVKELGIFKDGIALGYTFLPPNGYKAIFPAKWNTKNLHGINWNNGKVDYSVHPTIINQHCSPTTEYFAKGLENCKILSNYLCKDVEHLDDFGCPKVSKLIFNEILSEKVVTTPTNTRKHCTVQTLMELGFLIF